MLGLRVISLGIIIMMIIAMGFISCAPPTVDFPQERKDQDGDLLPDSYEREIGTDPLNPDTDADGLQDGEEVTSGLDGYRTNPLEADTDRDTYLDGVEFRYKTDPTDKWSFPDPQTVDSDQDGMIDSFEMEHGLNPLDPSDAFDDPDRDELNNLGEYQWQTDPHLADTDQDQILDGEETISGRDGYQTHPLLPDTDEDTLLDGDEVLYYKTNPTLKDSDVDGIDDGREVAAGLNPLDASDAEIDPDLDGLTNSLEVLTYGSDPFNPDTDGDNLPDGLEAQKIGSSAVNPDTDGDQIEDGVEFLGSNGYETNPLRADSDFDSLSDATEIFDGDDFTHPRTFNGLFGSVYKIPTSYQISIDNIADLVRKPENRIYTSGYVVNGLNFPCDGVPSENPNLQGFTYTLPDAYYAIRYTGEIKVLNTEVIEPTTFYFDGKTDDGAAVYINGQRVAFELLSEADGKDARNDQETGTVTLESGIHSVEVIYFQEWGDLYLNLLVNFPGSDNRYAPIHTRQLRAVHPGVFDSDRDGISDDQEIAQGTDPYTP